MNKNWLLAVASVALFSAPAAAQRDFPVEATPVVEDRYPDRLQSWPGGVTSMADVTYSTITGYRPMVIDIYMPPRDAGPKPLILYVHGGGWVAGHTRHSGASGDFPAALAQLAREGFVVASLEYRLAKEALFPAQAQDARAALRFLKGNAARFGIDDTRTGIWGGSAGGHLAALTALSCGDASLDVAGQTYVAGSECVQAAVIWYGVFDFGVLAKGRAGGVDQAGAALLGCKGPCKESDYVPASPLSYADAKDPPFLLIHGSDDAVVPESQSRMAEAKFLSLGVPVEAIYIGGVDHSFIGKTPEATRDASITALNATFDFFLKTLGSNAQ